MSTFIGDIDHGVGIGIGCDESKCVSKGLSYLYNNSHTCYGERDGFDVPMMCADGFLPVVIDSEPTLLHEDLVGFGFGKGQANVSYFTCCPPYQSSPNTNVERSRKCSDPISTSMDFDDEVCADKTQKNPRQMKSSVKWEFPFLRTVDSFVCCDSLLSGNNTNANFLDDLECVPYRSKLYEFLPAKNHNAHISMISCDLAESGFTIPRPL